MALNSLMVNGYKLPDGSGRWIRKYVRQSADNELARPTGDGIGTIEFNSNLAHLYAHFVRHTIDTSFWRFDYRLWWC